MKTTPVRVLFVASTIPWGRSNGPAVIIADLLEAIAGDRELEILPVFLRPPPAGYRTGSSADLDEVILGVETVSKAASVALAALSLSTPMRFRFPNRKVATLIAGVLASREFVPEVVHVEHLNLVDSGNALARRFGVPLVYRAHNIESALLADRFAMKGSLGQWAANAMLGSEGRAITECDLTLCISESDLASVRSLAPNARAELLPCSLLSERYPEWSGNRIPHMPRMGFVGGLEWKQNVDGLRWFVDEVLPVVIAQVPDARLAVMARGARQQEWLAGNRFIEIVDDHADAAQHLATSWLSIAPLRFGGGVRIKVAESLLVGCPVVATTVGGEGFESPLLRLADDAAGFAQACAEFLQRPPSEQARRQARLQVSLRHDARNHAALLASRWKELALGPRIETTMEVG